MFVELENILIHFKVKMKISGALLAIKTGNLTDFTSKNKQTNLLVERNLKIRGQKRNHGFKEIY